MDIELKSMTDEMYYEYFKEYVNDLDLYLDKDKYEHYEYDKARVGAYIERQKQKKRIPMAIVNGGELVGELIFKDIVEKQSVTIGIAMKNQKYKNRGFGTQAERLAIQYAFEVLGVSTVYADAILTNTRSQHVLEKVGFIEINRDDTFVYYEYHNFGQEFCR